MQVFIATASSDWGGIFYERRIEASTFSAAMARAGRMAHKESRKRPKQISINVRKVASV